MASWPGVMARLRSQALNIARPNGVTNIGRCCTKNSRVATRPSPSASGDTHRNRPTRFVHAAQSFDGYSGFGLALRMAARSQRVADNALVAADLHLDL